MARIRTNPLWTRAPLGLRRFPSLLVSVAGASALLTLALVVAPLYLSATANGALGTALGDLGPFGAGYSIVRNDPIDPSYTQRSFTVREGGIRRRQTFASRDGTLTEAFEGIDGVGGRVATIAGDEVLASSSGAPGFGVRPIHRTGAGGHVDVLSSVGGDGVLVPDIVADELRVEPGDSLRLTTADGTKGVSVRVKGIYEALSESPLSSYWGSLGAEIQLQLPKGVLPPPFVIASRSDAMDVIEALTPRDAQFRWEFPLEDPAGLSLEQARAIKRGFDDITAEFGRVRSPLGRLFWCHCFLTAVTAELTTGIDGAIRRASDRQASLGAPLSLLSNAGALIAVVLLGTVAVYAIHRRRAEVVYLLTRGMSPMLAGGRASLEGALPVLAGTVVGYLGARHFITVFLGGGEVGDDAVAEAVRRVGTAFVAVMVVLWAGSALAAARQMKRVSTETEGGFFPLWELPVIAFAMYGLFSVLGKDSLIQSGGGGATINSGLILLFPLALIGGLSGLVARLFKWALGRARRWSHARSDGVHLAVHRLSSAPQLAVMLFSACGLSLGTLVYAQTTGATIQENASTKAYVFVGSDVSAPVDGGYDELPSSFSFPWTVATQVLDQASLDDGTDMDIVAVDSATVGRAAYWDESFSDASLDELSDRLRSDAPGRLNVLSTEELPDDASLHVGEVDLALRPVGRLRAFPGMVADRPLLVADSERLRAELSGLGGEDVVASPGSFTQLWVKGDPSSIEEELLDLGFHPDYVLSAQTILERPVFVAIMRSFTFLRALGLLSSLIVLLGLLLYLQARQRQRTLLLALAERMGLTRRAHRSALALELGVMLLIALLVGGMVGIGVSALLFRRLDPLPTVAPSPSLVVPIVLGLFLVATLVVLTIAGAFLADRAARRVSLTEVLRYE